MKLASRLAAGLLIAAAFSASGALAAEIACPDLSQVSQVGSCPSEEELKYTFDGYCSDNARMFDKPENQLCTNYLFYRALKNYARWETPDGEFAGYVSCDPLKHPLAQAKATSVTVSKQGSITRVSCSYDNGVTFTYRSKQKCIVSAETAGQCGKNPTACKAECN